MKADADTGPGGAASPPLPGPNPMYQFYWDSVNDHRLSLLRCQNCKHFVHYPRPICDECQSTDLLPESISGRGTLFSFTTVMQAGHPYFVDKIPYVIGVIEIEEEPGVRLPAGDRRGRRWIDLRYSSRGGVQGDYKFSYVAVLSAIRGQEFHPMMKLSERVAAVGVGYSTTARRQTIGSWQLAIQACTAALNDAGMTPGDLDGVAVFWSTAGPAPEGLDVIDSQALGYMLGIKPLNWFNDGYPISPAYVAVAMQGIAAIRAGFAHTVLTVRIVPQRLNSTAVINDAAKQPAEIILDDRSFTAPYGFGVAGVEAVTSIAALPARRHMDLFGTTEEQFGAHVAAQRYHASMNDEAVLREPITVNDYLASRYISKPVRILDCDYPVDSASAIIYTAGDRANNWRKKPVWVESAAYSSIKYMDFNNLEMNESSPFHSSRELWNRTDLKPEDVDFAQLYDGFTIIVFQWLEALGFCKLGEAGPFIEAGHTRLGGKLPTNTDGGACNVGRRHGANFCIETVRQLRGECGDRQVPNAEVGVWSNAVGPFSGVVLMTADR